MVKEKYNKISKKFNLPKYEEINNEFEISTIENEEFLLRNVRRKILERIDMFIEILGSIVQPDTSSLSNMYECRIFDDEEKNDVFIIFKKLMEIKREAVFLDLAVDDKDDAKFIKAVVGQWKNLKPKIIPCIRKVKDSWEKETTYKEELEYLG